MNPLLPKKALQATALASLRSARVAPERLR